MNKNIVQAALVIAALAALAACSSAASSAASAPASSVPVAKAAAASAPQSPAATVAPTGACKALAAWERGADTGNIASDTGLQQTFAATAMPLSGDYAVWVSDIRTASPAEGAAADVVAGDCAGYGVIIFPSASSAAPSDSAPPPSAPAPSTAAAPPTAVTSAPAPAPPASSAPSLAGKTVATFSGSGIETTPEFTVTGTWKLDYSFDCSSFGGKGNFVIYEYSGSALGDVMVNELAMSGSSSSYGYDAGTHHLEVNSECSWTVKVVDEG